MAIPYRTAKFKSTIILPIAILGSTTKLNSRQYVQLYGLVYPNQCIMSEGLIHAYKLKLYTCEDGTTNLHHFCLQAKHFHLS